MKESRGSNRAIRSDDPRGFELVKITYHCRTIGNCDINRGQHLEIKYLYIQIKVLKRNLNDSLRIISIYPNM